MDIESAKLLGAGIAVLGVIGSGIGIGSIFAAFISAVGRNPEAREHVFTMTMLGFALVEALALFALIIALIALFAGGYFSRGHRQQNQMFSAMQQELKAQQASLQQQRGKVSKLMQQQGQTSLHPPEHQPSPQPAQVDWREWLGFMDQIQQRKEKSKRITVDDTTGKVHLYAGQDHEIMVAGPSTNYTLGGSAFALALLLVVTVGFFVRFLFDSPNLGEISKEADSTSSWTLPDVAITVAAAVDQASFCKCITSAVERYHHISYVFVVITKRRNNCEQLDK